MLLMPLFPMSRTRFHLKSAAICCGASLLLACAGGGGCDRSVSQADRSVDEKVSEAMARMNGSKEDRLQADSLLQAANNELNASIENKILAKEILAQNELRSAELMEPDIEQTQRRIDQLAWEIAQLAGQIQASNQVAVALSQYDPATVGKGQKQSINDALKQKVAEVQGSPDKLEWSPTEGTTMPSLAGLAKDQTALQGRIDELQKQIQSLTDQRNALLAKSDDLMQQSGNEKGDKSVDLFKQGADARKQADNLLVQIDQTNVQLTRVRQDLAVKAGQQEALNGAIAAFNKNSDDVAATWKTLQQQIQQQRQQAKEMLGDELNPASPDEAKRPPVITDRGLMIEELNKANRQRRDEAEVHLNNARDKFAAAVSLAEQLERDLQAKMSDMKNQGRPDADAWKAEKTALAPARFQIQQANADLHRARLFAGRAAEAGTRQQIAAMLKPILDAAKLKLPESFQDNDNKFADDFKNGREQAATAYKDADELLNNASNGSGSPEMQQAAHIARIFADYGWAQFATSTGDKETAKTAIDTAKAEVDAATSNGATIRNLPPELVKAPATAPTTAPSEATPAAPPAAPATPPAPQG
jgi:hypothetical protein